MSFLHWRLNFVNGRAFVLLVALPLAPAFAANVSKIGKIIHAVGEAEKAGEAVSGAGKVERGTARVIRNLEEIRAQKLARIKEDLSAAKQVRSLDHQIEAQKSLERLRGFLKSKFKWSDEEVDATALGMMDSDKGKLSEGIDLLTKESKDSDELLKVLSGNSDGLDPKTLDAAKRIQKLMGDKLPLPKMSPAELRQVFSGTPNPLVGFMHEYPGMSDAIKAFKSSAGTPADIRAFEIRIQANLFHNFPGEGFQKNVMAPLVEEKLKALGMPNFFKGTVLEGDGIAHAAVKAEAGVAGRMASEGLVGIPDPNNKYAFVHTLLDRLDQGTGGGWLKIREEVKFQKPEETIKQMLGSTPKGNPPGNPEGTLAQINKLEKSALARIEAGDKAFEGLSKADVSALVREARVKVETFQSAAQKVITLEKDGSVLVHGEKFVAGTPELEAAWQQAVQELLNIYKPMTLPF